MLSHGRTLIEFYERTQERLSSSTSLFPFPALLSFFFTLVLLNFATISLHQQLGNPADVLVLNAPDEKNGGIWFSLSIERNKLIVFFSSDIYFDYELDQLDSANYSALTSYLKALKTNAIVSETLALEHSEKSHFVTIAVDQKLSYYHVRPIISALAEAGYTSYGFETKNLKE